MQADSLFPRSELLIPGLRYLPDYISATEEARLLTTIEAAGWQQVGTMQRRVQQYGYRYSYRSRSVSVKDYLGALPDWGATIAQRLWEEGWMSACPNQLIVNRYLPGEGIGFHTDAPAFREVASLSLHSPCLMEFRHGETGDRRVLWLEPRSLLVLAGEARWSWLHGIPARQRDRHAGSLHPRRLRISLTYRVFPTAGTN